MNPFIISTPFSFMNSAVVFAGKKKNVDEIRREKERGERKRGKGRGRKSMKKKAFKIQNKSKI